jgi:hypothetical protein
MMGDVVHALRLTGAAALPSRAPRADKGTDPRIHAHAAAQTFPCEALACDDAAVERDPLAVTHILSVDAPVATAWEQHESRCLALGRTR